MSLARIVSASLYGLDALLVDVEVDAYWSDSPGFVLVGLPDKVVRESKDRVQSAVRNAGHCLQSFRCTVNLAPGHLKKEGTLYDLPVAVALLQSLGFLPLKKDLENYLIIGELGLSGETRPIFGALSIAMLAKNRGMKGILVPAANAEEAAMVPGIEVIPIAHLREALAFLSGSQSPSPFFPSINTAKNPPNTPQVDFSDIKGQAHAKRAMEIVAAGGHNTVLSGPPGSGKTMLAKALIGILPPMRLEEALETTKIHSIAGILGPQKNLILNRPFRAPHHTVSYAGLIGGGTVPRPGEVSLAHQGVLFLDELPEFSRTVLEVLRQPLEDRQVTISRAQGHFTFPSNFICVAAMNPCPCGYLGHPDKPCLDTRIQVQRYQGKISGPLWDRLDLYVEVPALRYEEIVQALSGESSDTIRERVIRARKRQYRRFGGVKTNALMTAREVKKYVPLDSGCQEVIRQAIDVMGVSARSCDRLLKVALTLRDLEEEEGACVKREHLMEALSYRGQS